MSSHFQIPIQSNKVKKRAEKKLKEMKANKKSERSATNSFVKPVHVSKDDPIVKRMLGQL
ncbi:hypothetical protein AN964_13115 [Heyndrickxia shackletonii]|uniref:Uncharacterized protein n=1 Tax=Heyndrickxia shackletonii TaxID=157838 RepID=A0A0Q3WYJ7_9BACI|nr:hypothetical protein [Heyndrickxia shackletonii]KQL54340.1 hypothetical protein AN964_13115 [Heyndrickxia shackletonii]MBB2480200.1 hypothetical protein [Bacillus sp. APMAM]NEZ01436.1 hypothetical protein [Heyndrickxia shackletonii]RTZ56404.1 hypothetical protein EKO25_07995 [Bacillus sp. SAJ1]